MMSIKKNVFWIAKYVEPYPAHQRASILTNTPFFGDMVIPYLLDRGTWKQDDTNMEYPSFCLIDTLYTCTQSTCIDTHTPQSPQSVQSYTF